MPDPTPLATPIETRPSPEVLDTLFYEFIDPESEGYVRLPVGSDYEQTGKYPGFKLVKEVRLEYNRAQRWWSNGQVNQDTWNYSIEYSGDGAGYDIFARRYLYRRDQYAELSRGTTFSGVYLAKVTAGGENYDEPPDIAASGGGGTGATFRAIINQNGELAWVLIVTDGTGFTSAPTLSVTGGGGTGGAVTAIIQPSDCVLVSEKASELAQDDPRHSLNLAVVRIYETLPGPWIPFTRYDVFLGPIQGRRRAVLAAGQTAALTATTKTTYEGRDGSSIVSWEIEETNTTGTGVGDQPLFPTTVEDDFTNEKGAIQRTTVVVVATGTEVGSSSVAGGVVTEIRYVPINQFLLKKITETWAVPVTRTDKEAVSVHGGGVATEVRSTSGTQSAPAGGLMVIKDESTDIGGGVFVNKVATVTGASWPILNWTHVDEKTGIVINGTKQVVAAGTAGGKTATTLTEVETADKWRSIQIVTTLPVTGDLPANEVIIHKRPKSFPDLVTDLSFLGIDVADAGADVGLLFKLKQGYSGECKARTTRKYMTAAVYAAYTPPAVTEFFPQGQQLTVLHTGRGRIWQLQVPISLHAAFSGTVTGFTGTDVPATSPTSVPLATWIHVDVVPTKLPLDLYLVEEIELFTPSQ